MALILCIETATKACSVALVQNGFSITEKTIQEDGYVHAELLHVLIDTVMKEAGRGYADLDGIAVGSGPGSYTGLRIGVSSAKGLAYSIDCPLISLPTLQVMAAMAIKKIESVESYLLRPLLDARRMEVYSASYTPSLTEHEPCKAYILDGDSPDRFSIDLDASPVYFFGDGMAKCRSILEQHKNAYFIVDVYPSASDMARLVEEKFSAKDFEDSAYFEPFYLKEFAAKKSKKLL